MRCPECKHENPVNAKFCMECGGKLENLCPKCGVKLPSGSKFCMECGTKLDETAAEIPVPRLEDMQDRLYIPEPLRKRMNEASMGMEGENRLVTAMFADISGFTSMSQQLSPEATVEKINRCFQVITDAIYGYEGSVNRFIGYFYDTLFMGGIVNGKFIYPGIHYFRDREVWLRIERKGERFTGYFSKDGKNWYRCGWVDIHIKDPIKVGIHAQCHDDSFSSTRFEYFRIYGTK